jgi:PTS system galactitol-specific IIC component
MLEPSIIVLQAGGAVQILESVRTVISDMGPELLLPIVLGILGLLFRVSPSRSLRLGLSVGVGFVGIFAVLGYTLPAVTSTVNALTETWGLNLIGVDIGWAPVAGFSWALGLTVLVIPMGFGINILMLLLGWTKTFDADVWNFWHWAFNAGFIYVLTGSWLFAFIGTIPVIVITLKLADWTADLAQEYFNIPGASLPHTQTIVHAPFAFAIDKALDRVPVINDMYLDADTVEDRMGVVGEPIVLGFLVGLFLGIIALQGPIAILRTAVFVAALLTLLPRMVGLLIEGLQPIADQASDYFNSSDRFEGEDFYIGIDAAPIALSDTATVVAGYLLIPFAIGLTVIPGITVVPLADLAILPIFLMWMAAISNGNLVRTLIGGVILVAMVTAATSIIAPYVTEMGRLSGGLSGVSTGGAELVSSLAAGAQTWSLAFGAPFALITSQDSPALGPVVVGIGLFVAVLAGICYYWTRERPNRQVEELTGSGTSPGDEATVATDD